MLINDLNLMEKIVQNNSQLSWDGWNVVRHIKSSNAEFSSDGAILHGQWYKRKIFPITEKGWYIPENIGRNYAPMEG